MQVYSLPHTVTFEPYLRAFQYKVSNAILYTNAKLFKIAKALVKMINVPSSIIGLSIFGTNYEGI